MKRKKYLLKTPHLFLLLIILFLISSCQAASLVLEKPVAEKIDQIPPGMSEAEGTTLSSLEQIDPFPLYIMVYEADYSQAAADVLVGEGSAQSWACSLFTAMSDPEGMLLGRNFDWDFSPALLLFTDPSDGYASVSMVDIAYLGYGEERAFGLVDLPLSELAALLDAPYLPFDGMNEAGLAVGMAAVSPGGMEDDPEKETIDSLMVIREILDQAATVDEAVDILESCNIDWGNGPPLHYLIAEKSGRSVLVEFSRGEMAVMPNRDPWQLATNFLVSESDTSPQGSCWRYDLVFERLKEANGQLNPRQALNLLGEVAQESTQWSVVYGISSREVRVVMGRQYDNVHTLDMVQNNQ
ncbi:MAG: linear amide C-N hydrolase [Anaerolineales bacterium]|nr:linear amide C-N hydrolase [Anaerolineales bacterium]